MNPTANLGDAHVVIAQSSAPEAQGLVPALYAVVADTPEEAVLAVRDVAPAGADIAITGGPLSPDTVERLALEPGHAKQIA